MTLWYFNKYYLNSESIYGPGEGTESYHGTGNLRQGERNINSFSVNLKAAQNQFSPTHR